MSTRSSDNSDSTPVEVVAQEPSTSEPQTASVLNHFDAAPMPMAASASTSAGQGSYIEQIKQQREIIRGHVQSVMNETQAKVEQAKQTGEFALAQDAISAARYQVQKQCDPSGQASG